MKINRLIRLFISAFNHILKIGRNNKIGWTTELRGSSSMRGCKIGEYCYIGRNCILQNVDIGNYVSIAPGTQIGGMEHAIYHLSTNTWLSNKGDDKKRTIIEHDVWIAAGCIIRQGIQIGQGAVIGANSFVNIDIPPYAIAVGSPAKIIKYRFESSIIKALINSDYYLLSPLHAKSVLEDKQREFGLL